MSSVSEYVKLKSMYKEEMGYNFPFCCPLYIIDFDYDITIYLDQDRLSIKEVRDIIAYIDWLQKKVSEGAS